MNRDWGLNVKITDKFKEVIPECNFSSENAWKKKYVPYGCY